MSREDQVNYASEGPLATERIRNAQDYAERKAEFKREMELFLRDEPRFGVTVKLTEEQLAEVTARTKQWNAKRKCFERELRERLGL